MAHDRRNGGALPEYQLVELAIRPTGWQYRVSPRSEMGHVGPDGGGRAHKEDARIAAGADLHSNSDPLLCTDDVRAVIHALWPSPLCRRIMRSPILPVKQVWTRTVDERWRSRPQPREGTTRNAEGRIRSSARRRCARLRPYHEKDGPWLQQDVGLLGPGEKRGVERPARIGRDAVPGGSASSGNHALGLIDLIGYHHYLGYVRQRGLDACPALTSRLPCHRRHRPAGR